MRIGKPAKKSRSWRKAGGAAAKGGKVKKPKYITSETVVGQISPDLIATVFAPKLKRLALESLERYADEMLHYEETLAALHNSTQQPVEAEIGVDGSSTHTGLPVSPNPPLFNSQARFDELDGLLTETSEHFMGKGYKVRANAAKFERSLDEKYGVLRPFVRDHPEIEQLVRSLQRKYAVGYFSPLRHGPPPIPRATAVILLFMLQRGGMRWEIVLLATLFFLVGLQPWALVAVISVLQVLLYRRKRKTVGKMSRQIATVEPYYANRGDDDKQAMLLQPLGNHLDENEAIDMAAYDVIMIGHGPGTLYAAALLSRAGRKVLVLSSGTDASGCLTFQNIKDNDALQNLPFDVENCSIAKISRQQELLSPALATTTDCQGGIRFAKIGSEADGYAFEILSVPGMGSDGGGHDHHVPFILKAAGGVAALSQDAATYLGDSWPESDDDAGGSLTGQYVAACEKMNASASLYYLSKILPRSVNKLRRDTDYADAGLNNCAALLNSCFPLNAHLRSLMAAIGMKGENVQPRSTCLAAHVTNVCAAVSGEGMHYPIGGPRALCNALAHVVEKNGGRIVSGAAVAELLFDESIIVRKRHKKADEPLAPHCVGVKLCDGTLLQFAVDRFNVKPPLCPVVVSMEGFIHTFIRFLSDDIRTSYKVPRGVPALSERRPVLHLLFALNGTATELNVTGADYYRLPGAAVARDTIDPTTGEVTCGEIGWSDEDTSGTEANEFVAPTIEQDEPSNGEATTTNEPRRRKKRPVKFETGRSWIRISFPSAKDPSFEARHGRITTCVATIEADDDFVTPFDTKPKIFATKKTTAASGGDVLRLCERVKKDLFEIFPQLEGTLVSSVSFASWTVDTRDAHVRVDGSTKQEKFSTLRLVDHFKRD